MSDKDNWQRVDELVNAAMDPPAAERDNWLQEACGNDEALLKRSARC